MEKELEVEKERDRARATKFLEPKFIINEPPPKVIVDLSLVAHSL